MTHHNLEAIMVKTTNGVAVAGILSPAWLPTLQDTSIVAAQLVPIFSIFWLVLQITRHFRTRKDNSNVHSGKDHTDASPN